MTSRISIVGSTMTPHKIQYFFAHGLKIPASGGALILGTGVAISCGALSFWAVVAILAALPLGAVWGMLVLGPFIRLFIDSLNGAPFQVGDAVHILIGPYRNRVVRVYEVWPSRGQVRVELGEQAEKNVKDVFWNFEVCRERPA